MQKVEHEPDPDELARLAGDAEIIIAEGYKDSATNKIEVFRQGVSGERPLSQSDPSYLALVSDKPFAVSIPCFDLNDATGVADLIVAIAR
jgi:molybdopterin-guanine dinucleotide biosynthesis protein B